MKNLEMIFIPSSFGLIKVYSYGFIQPGASGKVYATYNDIVVSSKGYNRKRTIIKALSKLHELVVNNQ
ncbi:hypothetical protein OEV98_01690 [Caldibacillus lycopersici]|uniref:Uncharacterized protein n=1 Tax=Perspicuibacillus lycopersici TaxID=1325689 RepID=A0AAE3IRD0_9BACI|nr:hypothetical protein [Perspicuibacillus lycopersici]MCU9612273.1 hypothetical protein [Perspicuibacillus lycopersici]